MASKSIHQPYNDNALKHFGFENDPIYGVFSSNSVHEVLLTDDDTSFIKIKNLLETETIQGKNIKNYKRGFVLPGCPVTLDRIKSAAKEHNVTITNDYEKADFIITYKGINTSYQHGARISTRSLLFELWNYDSAKLDHLPIINTSIPILIDENLNDVISGHYSYDTTLESSAITGLGLDLAYLIDIGEMEVLDINSLLNASANTTTLTEDIVDDIINWIESYDDDNKAMAYKLLPTIDYDTKPHLLWKLSQEVYHRIHSRDKDLKYWMNASEMYKLYNRSAEDQIIHLEETGKLDKESFQYLEKIVRKDIQIYNRELYVFKVSVKREYKKYLI